MNIFGLWCACFLFFMFINDFIRYKLYVSFCKKHNIQEHYLLRAYIGSFSFRYDMNQLYNEYVDKEQQMVDMYYDSNGYSAKEWRNSLIKEPLTKEEICHSEEDFEYFYDNLALGVLLINEVIIINNFFLENGMAH